MSFLGEIKRRKVFQVAAVYAVVAWLLVQVADVVLPALNAPSWILPVFIFFMILGFPITMVMSWAFNLTPGGLVREEGVATPMRSSGRKIEYVLFGLLAVAVIWVIYRVEFDVSEKVVDSSVRAGPAAENVSNVSEETTQGFLPKSIAILPFENLSPNPDNAYFAAGIHESTLNQLAKIHDLVVISRTSVMQYAENRPPISEIAKALNVATVMEGSVRYADGRVLITAQLIDGQTDAHLWSNEFNRELADVFAVQAEVAKQIATAMQVQLLPDERERIESRPTESTEAYQHYLRAMSLPYPLSQPEYWPALINSLERAIAADPKFAEAYAELAFAYDNRAAIEDIDKAVSYAHKAIELDPSLGFAYLTLGQIDSDYYARQEEARAAFAHAVELSPNNSFILSQHAYRLADNGENFAEAIRLLRRAVAVDPTEAVLHMRLGFVLMRSGNFAEAAEQMREAIEIDPVNYHEPYLNLATVHYLDGNPGEAKKNLDRAMEIMSSGATYRVDYVAYLYGLLGESEQAASLLARLEETYAAGRQSSARIGWAVLGTRDKKRALRNWTMTVDGYIEDDQPVTPGRISRFRDNWLNDPMLEEPEFLELRRRLGFKG